MQLSARLWLRLLIIFFQAFLKLNSKDLTLIIQEGKTLIYG